MIAYRCVPSKNTVERFELTKTTIPFVSWPLLFLAWYWQPLSYSTSSWLYCYQHAVVRLEASSSFSLHWTKYKSLKNFQTQSCAINDSLSSTSEFIVPYHLERRPVFVSLLWPLFATLAASANYFWYLRTRPHPLLWSQYLCRLYLAYCTVRWSIKNCHFPVIQAIIFCITNL